MLGAYGPRVSPHLELHQAGGSFIFVSELIERGFS